VIDTHCHLTFPDFAGRVPEVLDEAARHGVEGCITVGTTTDNALECLALAERHDRVWCTAGVHPLYADRAPHQWDNLARAILHPRCVAWGELGLDRHHPTPDYSLQRRVLDEHIAIILATRRDAPAIARKPVVLHCRDAFDELIPILRSSGLDTSRMVFHCFTGTPDDARKVLDMGAWLGFTGVLTYRNAEPVRQAARLCPLDRLLVETDAPYLSPDPHRGVRPCEPWMASVTARRLAQVKDVAWDDFHRQLDDNTRRFFGIGERP
jgi:TatD DNase family protein